MVKDYIIHIMEGQYEGMHGIESWLYLEQIEESVAVSTADSEENFLISDYGLDEKFYEEQNEDSDIENEDFDMVENYIETFGNASVIYELDPQYKIDYPNFNGNSEEECEEIAEKYGTTL